MAVSDDLVDLLMGRAKGKRVPVPEIPKNWRVKVGDKDGAELAADARPDPHAVAGALLGIDYVDAYGNPTSRRLKPVALKPAGDDWRLYAVCMERRDFRCFLLSRIEAAIDLHTGEIFEDWETIVLGVLGITYGRPTTPADSTRIAWRQFCDGINALVFLSRCDGHHHPGETDAILSYIDHVAPSPGVDIALAKDLIGVAWVDEGHYMSAITKLAQYGSDHITRVARHARKVIDADGAISEDEARFADMLGRLIR